jgi:hypothetical protein
MPTALERSTAAREALDGVIREVCGSCVRNCCHQGTMMGSQDVRRLVKGVRIEPGRAETVRAGLRLRSAELRADLQVIKRVADMLSQTSSGLSESDAAGLQRQIAEWESVCDFLESDFPLDFEHLVRLLLFSATRSNTLHALARYPGALSALVNLGRGSASFRFVHKRIAPPRCLYHVESAGAGMAGGCVAGRWKPAKCANFFCPGDPNVLHSLREAMTFDDFVIAFALPATTTEALAAIRVELDLGPQYAEPKILIGYSPTLAEDLARGLTAAGMSPKVQTVAGHFLRSTAEVCADLEALPPGSAPVILADSVDGASLYELAVALDRFRSAGRPQALFLLVSELKPKSFIPHPLWADEMMAQPLGSLDILLCSDP